MPLKFNDETPSEYITRMFSEEAKAFLDGHVGTLEGMEKRLASMSDDEAKFLGFDPSSILSKLSNFLPSEKQLQEFNSKVKPTVRAALSHIASKHNRNIYVAPESKTRFQIGPLTYGSEVQSIKILENKAISVSSGVRTTSDFIIDGGTGDADAQVTMIFSGIEHTNKALRPLVALFRLSPITSVKNATIEAALYSRFTENKFETLDARIVRETIEDTTRVTAEANVKELLEKINSTRDENVTEASLVEDEKVFEYAKNKKLIHSAMTWEEFQEENNIEVQVALATSYIKDKPRDVINSGQPESHNDFTGFVPMAIIGLELSTHPELPEALVCSLMLKRVNVGNFLKDHLQYRDFNGNAVNDPKKAFWLNRAIDIYIKRYIGEERLADFGSVTLKFQGESKFIKKFIVDAKDPNSTNNLELEALDINDGNKTFVTQITYGLYHKFHFCRLIGESYPTAQHMGTSSGTLSVSITTPDINEFKTIHTYKSAADFLVRHSEKITRFKGWTVDTYLTRLFNFTQNPTNEEDSDTIVPGSGIKIKDAFYPKEVISSTDDDLPGIHHIAITFQQTNPDFFDDFGFTIAQGDHSINTLWKFYSKMYDRAIKTKNDLSMDPSNLDKVDMYSYNLIFGDANPKENMMLFNPNTIIAAFLETQYYHSEEDSDEGKFITDNESDKQTTRELLSALQDNEFLNGRNDNNEPSLYDQLASGLGGLGDVILDEENDLARKIFDLYFVSSTGGNPMDIIKNINMIAEPSAREDLYRSIISSNKFTFTGMFKKKLFTAIIRRRFRKGLTAVYERSGVIKAFYALTIGYEANSDEFFPEETKSVSEKSKPSETKIVINEDGKFELSREITTAYNDYMYLTYHDLFTLDGIPGLENHKRWEKFGLRYYHIGAINSDLKILGSVWSTANAKKANDQLIDIPTSPVPPDIFFYREDELSNAHVNLDDDYEEWFSMLGALILPIPRDVETHLRDNNGNRTGKVAPGRGKNLQISSHIERQHDIDRNKGVDATKWADLSVDILGIEMQGLLNDDSSGWTTEKALKAISEEENGPNYMKLKADVQRFKVSYNGGLAQPHVLGSGLGSELASFHRLIGVSGSAYARVLTRVDDDKIFKQYLTETITKSASGALTDMVVTGVNLEENKASMMKILQATPDIGNTMAKAFPVMRLYLIEERGPNLIVQDNFYGYQAIDSIDITLDKSDAALAVIRLADPFRILQGSEFGKLKASTSLKNEVALPTDGGLDENFQNKVKLRQGRHIQIRGGYSSSPDHLDILFTGRIAELQFGDMVTIVAQGWKAEIAGKQVSFGIHATEDNSVKDLVVRTITDAKPKGIGTYFSGREFNKIASILGDLTAGEQVMQARTATVGTTGTGASLQAWGFNLGKGLTNVGAGVDMRFKNVWVPDTNQIRWNLFKNAIQNGWQGTRWIVPMTSAWNVLEMATNYVWGYMCQVVPFDSEATLFFGKPENLYYYKTGDAKMSKEVSKQKITTIDVVKKDMLPPIIQHSKIFSFEHLLPPIIQHSKSAVRATYTSYSWALSPPGTPIARSRQVTDVTKAKILNVSYNVYFDDLSGIFNGNKSLVSRLLLASFYGLSITYIEKNIPNHVQLVKLLLSPEKPPDEANINVHFDNGINQDTVDKLNEALKTTLASGNDRKAGNHITIEDIEGYVKAISESLDDRTIKEAINNLYLFDTTYRFIEKARDSWNRSQVKSSDWTAPIISMPLKKVIPSWALPSTDLSDMIEELDGTFAYGQKQFSFISITPLPFAPSATLGSGKTIWDITVEGKIAPGWVSELDSRNDKTRLKLSRVLRDALDIYNGILIEERLDDIDRNFIAPGIFDDDFVKISNNIYFDTISMMKEDEDFGDAAVQTRFIFKEYVKSLYEWVNKGQGNIEEIDHAIEKATDLFTLNPSTIHNMKVFRDYHYVKNGRDILSNDLAATTREMHNTVVVKFPEELETSNERFYTVEELMGNYSDVQIDASTTWTSWPKSVDGHMGMQFDDSVVLEDKKVGVYTDLNITRTEQAAIAGTNVLTKMMRPMYRNSITILGRSMKPWDYVVLDDKYTDMKGILDVERVVHHYSASSGWTTKFVPHAICEANPGNRQIQAAVMQSRFDTIYNISENVMNVIVLLTMVPTLGASLEAGAAIKAAAVSGDILIASAIKSAVTSKLVHAASREVLLQLMKGLPPAATRYILTQGALLVGDGAMSFWSTSMRSGDVTLPVIMNPIMYKGTPLQAGLHGMDETYWSLGSRVYWSLRKWNDTIASLIDLANLQSQRTRSINELAIELRTRTKRTP